MAEYSKEKPTKELDELSERGLLAVFARHQTAPNIIMLIMVLFGLWAATKIPTQFFPEIVRDRLTISENWSGASSEDVDQALIQVIEPSIRFIEGADEVSTSAQEGSAVIQIEYVSGINMSEANADADAAVNALTGSLPEDANDPRIRRSPFRDFVSNIILSGPYERLALLEFAEEIREGLLDRGLLQVDIIGTYRPEIRIEPRPNELQRLGLSINQLASILSEQSQDTPAGDISGGDRLVRTLGQLSTAEAYKYLEVKSLPDGTKVVLSDIATITEINAASGVDAFRNREPAIELSIKRGAGGDSLKQQRIVDDYIEELRGELPANLKVDLYNIRADVIKARLNLLVENGIIGLIIVLVLLFMFLNWRTAFWVAAGIPISLAATIGFMYFSGQSINMISLFALILTLGIIVDDAIVVGEHSDALYSNGFKPATAAILGAQRMAGPVVSASLTTIIAFGAILVIGGRFGALLQAIPLAVVAVLIASLIECFIILPGHMRHSMVAQNNPRGISGLLDKVFSPIRRIVDVAFNFFKYRIFRPTVKFSLYLRYPIIALCIVAFMISVAAVSAKKIPFRFFVAPEFNSVNANVSMLNGASREDTIQQLNYMQDALEETIAKLSTEERDKTALQMAISKVGGRVGRSRGAGGGQDADLIGGFSVELSEQDDRSFSTFEFSEAWQDAIKKHPRLDSISLRSFRGGPRGDDVDVRLNGDNLSDLKAAAGELLQYLENVPGVSGSEDDMPYGKSEYQLRVTPRGRSLGFDASSLGKELRSALEGVVVERFVRDNREVTVKIKLPETELSAAFLFDTEVRSSNGAYVPLSEVVEIEETQGFAVIRRFGGQRQVSVTADLDADQNTIEGVQIELENSILPELQAKYNLSYTFEGRAKQQQEFQLDAIFAFLGALGGIYLILSWVFSSFFRPLVVILVIPLGFVGMVLGHYVNETGLLKVMLGYDAVITPLSLYSVIGFLGLTGIIVNDSIVLVTTIDRRAKDQPIRSAIIDGTTDRLRAVILTSATTIGGLMPLLYETSVQAKFLIPTVITMVYGLGLGTVLVLFVAPALVAIQNDISQSLTSFRRYMRYLTRRKRRYEPQQT